MILNLLYLFLVLASSKTDFIITASNDGHIKFWKKTFHLIEFVKHFRAHNGLLKIKYFFLFLKNFI